MINQNSTPANTEIPLVIKTLSIEDVKSVFGCCTTTAVVRRQEVAKALGKSTNMITREDILYHYKIKV